MEEYRAYTPINIHGEDEDDEDEGEEQQLSAEEHVRRLRVAIKQARDDRWAADTKTHLYRSKLQSLHYSLAGMKKEVCSQRFCLTKVREQAKQLHSLVHVEMKGLMSALQGVIEGSAEKNRKTQEEKKLADIQKQLQRALQEVRDRESEMQKMEEEFRHKSKEAELLGVKVHNVDLLAQQKVAKQERFSKEQTEELKSVRREVNVLQLKCGKQQKSLDEISGSLSTAQNEAGHMKALLGKATSELETTRAESERLKGQLTKLEHTNKDLTKKVQESQDDASHLVSQLKSREIFWKDKYKQDLDKEKKAFKIEMTSLAMEHGTSIDQLRHQMSTQQKKLRDKVASLQRQLHETRDTAAARERELKAEIDKLRRQLANRPTEDDIPQAIKCMESSSQEQLLEKYKHKVGHLEELMKKECMERESLLKAFHEAKRELLVLKKPTGGYGEQTPRNPAEETMFLFKKRTSTRKAEAAPVGFVDFQQVPLRNILKVKDPVDLQMERDRKSNRLAPGPETASAPEIMSATPIADQNNMKALVKGSRLLNPDRACDPELVSPGKSLKSPRKLPALDGASQGLTRSDVLGRQGRSLEVTNAMGQNAKVAKPKKPHGERQKRLHQTA